MPKTILKTGVEWERLFIMDEGTFYRHLRVTHAQFDYLLEVLRRQGLDREQKEFEIPLRQKVGLPDKEWLFEASWHFILIALPQLNT